VLNGKVLFVCEESFTAARVPDQVLALSLAGCNSMDSQKLNDIVGHDLPLLFDIDSGEGIKVVEIPRVDDGGSLVFQLH
jgi:hypothetical protein